MAAAPGLVLPLHNSRTGPTSPQLQDWSYLSTTPARKRREQRGRAAFASGETKCSSHHLCNTKSPQVFGHCTV